MDQLQNLMPLSKGMARFNRAVTNRITRPFAARLGGFAVIQHQGRFSRESYETPVNAWRHDDQIVVALTYGDDVDWLKNARASEASSIVMRGEEIEVGRPVDISTDDGMAFVSRIARFVLPLLKVDLFIVFPIVNQPS